MVTLNFRANPSAGIDFFPVINGQASNEGQLHAFKHHQATVEEFGSTRAPWRWRHLVGAAQAAAISYGKNMELYEAAIELLHAKREARLVRSAVVSSASAPLP